MKQATAIDPSTISVTAYMIDKSVVAMFTPVVLIDSKYRSVSQGREKVLLLFMAFGE